MSSTINTVVDNEIMNNETKLNFEEKKYFVNGNIKELTSYNNQTLKDGLHRKWNRYGVLVLEEVYKNGKRNGCQKVWNDEGVILFSMEYLNGKMHGKNKVYNAGKPILKRIFENGREVSAKSYR